MVHGHVDDTNAKIVNENGSWRYYLRTNINPNFLIKVQFVSMRTIIANTKGKTFEVAIIPYTYENTNFKALKANDLINIEYDILAVLYFNLKT